MAHSPTDRVESLIEALPYIQKFRGQRFVIKYGGSAMEDDQVVERFLRDVVFLHAVGIQPVLVHGGGKAITQRMRDAGLKPRFVNGLRVTDEQTIRIVEEVLDTQISPGIVQQLIGFGARAIGIPGKRVLLAKRLPPQSGGKVAAIDLGVVGEGAEVRLDEVQKALADGALPVISPLGQDAGGSTVNVNADTAAGTIA